MMATPATPPTTPPAIAPAFVPLDDDSDSDGEEVTGPGVCVVGDDVVVVDNDVDCVDVAGSTDIHPSDQQDPQHTSNPVENKTRKGEPPTFTFLKRLQPRLVALQIIPVGRTAHVALPRTLRPLKPPVILVAAEKVVRDVNIPGTIRAAGLGRWRVGCPTVVFIGAAGAEWTA